MQRPNKSLSSVGSGLQLCHKYHHQWKQLTPHHSSTRNQSKIACKLTALYHGYFMTSWISWCMTLHYCFFLKAFRPHICTQTTHVHTRTSSTFSVLIDSLLISLSFYNAICFKLFIIPQSTVTLMPTVGLQQYYVILWHRLCPIICPKQMLHRALYRTGP